MIIGAFIFAFLQVVLLASLVHAVNVNNEIQEGLFQSGRIMIESLQHILSVQTGIHWFSPRPMMTAAREIFDNRAVGAVITGAGIRQRQ